jgi:prevent-host-death family protein
MLFFCGYTVATPRKITMKDNKIGIRDLKNNTSQIMRAVREEKAEYIVTHHGEPIAILRPLTDEDRKKENRQALEKGFAELDELARKVAENWTSDKTAVELVAEQRRY